MCANNEGFVNYKTNAEVPEPLFIDLVRNLGAVKGEWEINTLMAHSQGYFRDVNWAPEIEWVIKDGSAIEFEFPMQGERLNAYKVAFQQTLFKAPESSTLHGLQWIYETNKEFTHSEGTLFYILAHRLSHELSTIILAGAKSNLEAYKGTAVIWNQSFFYNHSREVDLGLEVNFTSAGLGNKFVQVVPQVHLALKRGYKIQFGWGGREDRGDWGPVGILRIIKEFNRHE